jgi:hypothetical protein
MEVRVFRQSDLSDIEKLHQVYQKNNFSLPKIAEAYADIVVEEEGKILGYGQNRDITEAIMLLDLSLPLRVRGRALSAMIRESVYRASLKGHDQIHAFVQDSNFERALKNHFGFKDTKGKALVMNF